jgi:hypothetical protein
MEATAVWQALGKTFAARDLSALALTSIFDPCPQNNPQHLHRNPYSSAMSMQEIADTVHQLDLDVPNTPVHLAIARPSSRRRDFVICYPPKHSPLVETITDCLLL